MTTITLTTCTIRPWRVEDREALIWYADDVRVAATMPQDFPSPFTFREADVWLARTVNQSPYFDFAIEVDGEAVGSISLLLGEGEHRSNGEITLWIGKDFWGRGIATEAVQAITYYGLERFDLQRVYALVFASNAAARRVFEKNEYALLGQITGGVPRQGVVMEALVYAFDADG